MADECETPEYDEGPCHCAYHDPGRAEEAAYERAREVRVAALYRDLGPLDMATRIADLEEELGADEGGICTGMHADVAEAHAEIERLRRALWLSEAKVGGAALYVSQADARSDMLENAMEAYEGIADELEAEKARLRLAWTSARRRAKRARCARESELRHTRAMWGNALRDLHRYRLAWLSARRRAAVEATLAAEAIEHLTAEVVRLRATAERVA